MLTADLCTHSLNLNAFCSAEQWQGYVNLSASLSTFVPSKNQHSSCRRWHLKESWLSLWHGVSLGALCIARSASWWTQARKAGAWGWWTLNSENLGLSYLNKRLLPSETVLWEGRSISRAENLPCTSFWINAGRVHVLVHGHPKVPPEQMFNPSIRSGVTPTKPGAKHCLHDSQFDRLTGQQGASTWGCCLASGCCGGVSVMGQVQLGSNLLIRLNTNTVLCVVGESCLALPSAWWASGVLPGEGEAWRKGAPTGFYVVLFFRLAEILLYQIQEIKMQENQGGKWVAI